MAKGIVPLISSGVAGPLGVVHLPRLWCKVLLSTKGQLPEGYSECGSGFDQMVLDGLKLNREATLNYLKGNLPTYAQFEQWVLSQKGGKLDLKEVADLNHAIRSYHHSDQTVSGVLSGAGMKNDGSVKDAVTINNYDDWSEFHALLTK